MLGPGSFDISGPDGAPFYDADERAHLRDARLLLLLCLAAGAISILGIGTALGRATTRRATWLVIARAGLTTAIAVVVIGLVSLVAFDSLFTLFHRLFFPGGNWSFDPAAQRLVQLYPFRFWQIASAALGVVVLVLGLAAWWLGRRAAGRTMSHSTPPPQEG